MNVEIYEDEPRAGTYLIAQGFDRNHKKVLELVRSYESDFKDFGPLKGRKLKSTGGRAVNEILLNESQTMFLGALMKNNKQVVAFKKLLVKKFKECSDRLKAIETQKTSDGYHVAREASLLIRRDVTDVMKAFVEYAKDQGSKKPEMYYMNITKMMNGLLFIVDGKFKNLREVMSVKQLMTTSSAEQIIDRGLKDGMSRKKFYKDIYLEVKEKVMIFADLHGQSEIIAKQLECKGGNEMRLLEGRD